MDSDVLPFCTVDWNFSMLARIRLCMCNDTETESENCLKNRPKIIVSRCLMCVAVRYDGRHKRQEWLAEIEGCFSIADRCSEVDSGGDGAETGYGCLSHAGWLNGTPRLHNRSRSLGGPRSSGSETQSDAVGIACGRRPFESAFTQLRRR